MNDREAIAEIITDSLLSDIQKYNAILDYINKHYTRKQLDMADVQDAMDRVREDGVSMMYGATLLNHMREFIYNLMDRFDKGGTIPFVMPDNFDGWIPPVRLDKVVDKVYICESAHHDDCPQKRGMICLDDEHNCYNRPATIRDLIEGRE
jgi:hypothetical protein